jgi:hypothetical protein
LTAAGSRKRRRGRRVAGAHRRSGRFPEDGQHQAIFAQARRFDETVRAREPRRQHSATEEALLRECDYLFLSRWLLEHVASSDRALGEHLRARAAGRA